MKTPPPLPVITRHVFKDARDAYTIAAFGPTPEAALATCSESCQTYLHHIATEVLPYNHAERAVAVSAALPGDWTAKPASDEYADCAFYLTRADGLTLYLNGPNYSNRSAYTVSLNPPRYEGMTVDAYEMTASGWQRITSPTIGTSAMKTPEQTAADITRRLLPHAEKHHAATLATIARRKASNDAQNTSAELMAVELGTPRRTDYHTKKPATDGHLHALDWKANEGGSVDFKINSCSPETAVHIARALRSILIHAAAKP